MKEEELRKLLSRDYDDMLVEKIIKGMQEKRKVTLRINTLKASKEEILQVLNNEGIEYNLVSWYQDAFIIENKAEEDIRNLDIYKDGKVYLQSLSAMIPALMLDPQENETILDMTAAPGGKTTQIAALGHNKVMITAVEKNKIRAERLKYNIDKMGVKKAVIINEDARKLNGYKFDKVLLDTPCSGSGTLRIIDGVVEQEFSEELIARCVKFQEKLLLRAIDMVMVGHDIVYSTCSILKCENEEIIKKFVDKGLVEIVNIDKDRFKNMELLPTSLPGVLGVAPNLEYEGFFVAHLRKI